MPAKAPDEPTMTISGFLGSDDRERIPVAGLLAGQPALRDEEHTCSDWQTMLDSYLRSTRI